MNEPPINDHTVSIKVTVPIAPGSTENPDPDQLVFDVDQPTIHIDDKGNRKHRVRFELSGVYNDGTSVYPATMLMLRDDGGIQWYPIDKLLNRNPDFDLTADQKERLQRWLDHHHPQVHPGNRRQPNQQASTAINWAGMKHILPHPSDSDPAHPFRLSFRVGVQVCAGNDEAHPWISVNHDPEVDIEMDA